MFVLSQDKFSLKSIKLEKYGKNLLFLSSKDINSSWNFNLRVNKSLKNITNKIFVDSVFKYKSLVKEGKVAIPNIKTRSTHPKWFLEL